MDAHHQKVKIPFLCITKYHTDNILYNLCKVLYVNDTQPAFRDSVLNEGICFPCTKDLKSYKLPNKITTRQQREEINNL